MSAHVLLNLLTKLGKRKCEACQAFYLFFAMNLINSTGARMLDSSDHMTILIENVKILSSFTQHYYNGCH